MPATGPRYTATFECDEDGLWVVSLAEEPNVLGYGDTLAKARRNIRDAITTILGPFGSEGAVFELVENVRLPTVILDMVSLARQQRQRASQQLAEARAAEEALVAVVDGVCSVTHEAARLVVEHGLLVEAHADDVEREFDTRLPDEVTLMLERAHRERQAADRQRQAALLTHEAARESAGQAATTNRRAARMLIEQCGVTTADASSLLGVSPERTRRLLAE